MKNTLLITLLLLTGIAAHSQTRSWLWAQGGAGNFNADGYSIKTDPSGNIYLTGSYQGKQLILGTDTLVNADTSGYQSNIFLLKYDPAGNIIWQKVLSNSVSNITYSVLTTDLNGNVYLAGDYNGTLLTVGDDTLYNNSTGSRRPDFIIKFTPAGDIAWATSPADTATFINNIATDAADNVYLTGYYSVGMTIWGNDTLNSQGGYDGFVASLDTGGHVRWANNIDGPSDDYGTGITADAAGNSYVTGTYASPTLTLGTITLTNASGNRNMFTAKYGPTGTIIWAQTAGGITDDESAAIATDAQGNIYITGKINSAVVAFGTVQLTNPDSTAGYPDAFIAKYDGAGNAVWARGAGGSTNATFGYALSSGGVNDIYLTGNYSGPMAIWGADTLVNPNPVGQQEALYIVDFDTLGNVHWLTQAGGGPSESSNASGITADASGNVYVTGSFYSTLMLFGNDTLYATGYDESDNMFIAKYGPVAGTGIPVVATTSANITVYPNPNAVGSWQLAVGNELVGAKLQVFDEAGRLVFNSELPASPAGGETQNSKLQLNVPSGIYFLRISNGNVSEVRKLVKM